MRICSNCAYQRSATNSSNDPLLFDEDFYQTYPRHMTNSMSRMQTTTVNCTVEICGVFMQDKY